MSSPLNDPTSPQKGEVRLDPGVQARLLEQMRQEQAASMRVKQLRMFVLFPGTIALMVVSVLMAFSPDSGTSIMGSFLAQGVIMFLWFARKRLGAVFGFG